MIVDLTGFGISGYCDRLWAVTLCVAVAKLRGDSTLYFRDISTEKCPEFIMPLIDVRGFELKPWYDSLGEAEYRLDCLTSLPSIENAKLLKPSDLNVDDHSFLNSWLSAYRLLTPKPHIQEKIHGLNVDGNCLGFHLRLTDKVNKNPLPWEIHEDELKRVERRTFTAIKDCLKGSGLKKIYLASDDGEGRRQWKEKLERWKIEVIMNDHAVYDTNSLRQTSGEDFMIDLFSLSKCCSIVATVDSGVPLAAARISGRDTALSLVFGRHYSPLVRAKWAIKKCPGIYPAYLRIKARIMKR